MRFKGFRAFLPCRAAGVAPDLHPHTEAVGTTQGTSAARRAFISYVRQDAERVDRLRRLLEAQGVAVWRDSSGVRPGQEWKMEIRQVSGAARLPVR